MLPPPSTHVHARGIELMRTVRTILYLLLILALAAPAAGIGTRLADVGSQPASPDGAGPSFDGPVPVGQVDRTQRDDLVTLAAELAAKPRSSFYHRASTLPRPSSPPPPAAPRFLTHCALLC